MDGKSNLSERPSCSSLRDHDSQSTGPVEKPCNRKRRRMQPIGQQHNGPVHKVTVVESMGSSVHPRNYVEVVALKFGGKHTMARCRTANDDATSSFTIGSRLLNSNIDCNIHDLSCGVSMCGRVFDSIHVLAFHMSYAHNDISSRLAGAQCLVCGVLLNSAKGKIAHLMSRHRQLANDHNLQCLEQRETVISPLAPAAFRIEDDAIHHVEEVHPENYEECEDEAPIYENSTLQDICDMIVIPEVNDIS